MATAPLLEVVENAPTDIVAIVHQTPVVVLIDAEKRSSLYAHIEREIEAFEPDVTTAKGRDAIKSLAFKVTRTKTAIDAAGKQLNEEARAKINAVDEARRDARNTLDILAERARKPLTDWEDAEKARAERGRALIDRIVAAANVSINDTAQTVRDRGSEIWELAVDADVIGDELFAEASAAKQATVTALKTALERLTREEADRAELERLRAENEARAAKEREESEARERAQREAEAARQAEERRVAAEEAEKERIADAERAAAEAARREADERHAAELAAERKERERIEAEAQAERDRVARESAEQAAREANKAHRTKCKTAAKQAIMTCGVSEDAAQKIVLAIIAREVPHVRLEF